MEFSVSLELKKNFYKMLRELRRASSQPFSIMNRINSDKIYSLFDAILDYEDNRGEDVRNNCDESEETNNPNINFINGLIDEINDIRTFEPSNDFTYSRKDLQTIKVKFQRCYDFIDGCKVTGESCEVGEDDWKKHPIFNVNTS